MEGSLRGACLVSSVAACVSCLIGCQKFEQYQVKESGTGLYATIAVPPSGGAWTLCLDNRPRERCSPREALFYGYRGEYNDVRWAANGVLVVTQFGGEIRRRPREGGVNVAGRRVDIRVQDSPRGCSNLSVTELIEIASNRIRQDVDPASLTFSAAKGGRGYIIRTSASDPAIDEVPTVEVSDVDCGAQILSWTPGMQSTGFPTGQR